LSSQFPIEVIERIITSSDINPVNAIKKRELFEKVATNKDIPMLHIFETKEKAKKTM